LTASNGDRRAKHRILEILDGISTGNRILPALLPMIRDPDPSLSIEICSLDVQADPETRTGRRKVLKRRNPRVRAKRDRGVVGDWTLPRRKADLSSRPEGFLITGWWGNALLGLYLAADLTSIPLILEMVGIARRLFVPRSAWVMGRTGDPRFLPALTPLLRDEDGIVRRHVLMALGHIKRTVDHATRRAGFA